jgi:TolA-binding protein
MTKHSIILAAGLAAWLAAAPAAGQNRETRQMMADIRMLQEQSQLLQNTLVSLTAALEAVSARLDQQTETTRKSFADQKLSGDALAADLRVVREKIDDGNVRLGSLTQEVDALRQSVIEIQSAPPALPEAFAGVPSPADAAASTAPPVAPPARTTPPSSGMSPARLWQMAYAEYAAGQYDLAVIGFESFIREFPKSEQADDAQLHIAQAYMNAGQDDKAAEAADVAIRTYPKSDTIAQAYVRKGQALRNLKRYDEAREAFDLIIKNYPASSEATIAKQGLEQIKIDTKKP